MGERSTDWGAAWLFVLWALMVMASISGWHASSDRPEAAHAYKEKTRSLSSFTLTSHGTATTTPEKGR